MNELPEPWRTAGEQKGLTSLRAIARESGAAVETVRKVLAGHRKPSPATTEKLAAALGVSKSKINEWSGQRGSDIEEAYEPPAQAVRLTARQRKAVDEIIMAMVEPRAGVAESNVVQLRPAQDLPEDWEELAADSSPNLGKAEHESTLARGEESQETDHET